jgi:hypothetical protein
MAQGKNKIYYVTLRPDEYVDFCPFNTTPITVW